MHCAVCDTSPHHIAAVNTPSSCKTLWQRRTGLLWKNVGEAQNGPWRPCA